MASNSPTADAGPPLARGGVPNRAPLLVHRGTPTGAERVRLRAAFGAALVRERAARRWSQAALAEASGVHIRSVKLLEWGERRPSVGMCWRLASALRRGFDDEAVAALAARLADLAGPSLRDRSRRPHRRRERLMAAARARARGGVPTSAADRLTDVAAAALSGVWPTPRGTR